MGPFGRSGVPGGAGRRLIGISCAAARAVSRRSASGPGSRPMLAYPVTRPLVVAGAGTLKYWLVGGVAGLGPRPKPFAAVHSRVVGPPAPAGASTSVG